MKKDARCEKLPGLKLITFVAEPACVTSSSARHLRGRLYKSASGQPAALDLSLLATMLA